MSFSHLSKQKIVTVSGAKREEIATMTTGKESIHFPFSDLFSTCIIKIYTVLLTHTETYGKLSFGLYGSST